MKKGYLVLLVVIVLVVVAAMLYRQNYMTAPTPLEREDILKKTGVNEHAVPAEAIKTGMPANKPFTVPLYAGVAESAVYVDSTRADNYFYSVDASLSEVFRFFKEKLPTTQFHETATSFSADLLQNGLRTNVFASSDKPTIYPQEVAGGNTYISVTYNLQPLPSAEDILK